LEVLNLENVGLANVPDELHHLDKLQVLILRRNKISYLPDSFTKLISLEICDLSECCLMDLPLGIAELLNLKSLWLHGNKANICNKMYIFSDNNFSDCVFAKMYEENDQLGMCRFVLQQFGQLSK